MAYLKNIRMFVRVYELGSMSAAARDQRCSPAVASSRIADLERHLGVRLFNRSTRSLQPTEIGRVFYSGACEILEAVARAEESVSQDSDNPRGTLFIAAGLGIGRRLIAPALPEFNALYPNIDIRLRLSDRGVDMLAEGLDLLFLLGDPPDSSMKIRGIADIDRLLCAAPAYIARRGAPADGAALIAEKHACLALRYPGATEFQWALQTGGGVQRFAISGPFESDDGDVLTEWALDGHGIILKPRFEVQPYLDSGALVPVATATPPLPTRLSCLTPHRRMRESKIGIFADFMIPRIRAALTGRDRQLQ